MQYPPRKPEVMSPAGHWPQLRAAIEAGADAVYFGLTHFTARAKAGFALDELPEAIRTLHRRGVRGYITFNTLIFEHELAQAAETIAAIVNAGADALIVQDYAAVRLAREIAPEVELHASTQMSITCADGVRLALEQGIRRVTLARELSIQEIASIASETGAELEVFVHGALCVAYSGQCFSSEAWGGRSANRGQCAQACRLPYELMVDGAIRPLGDARYLLSPGDLYALKQIPEIVAAGVAALKIEGRYKDADYVALATSAYRKAVDEACAGLTPSITPAGELALEQVYSRGLGPFFLTGTNHQAVVRGRSGRHRGVCLGRVARMESGAVVIAPAEANRIAPLKAGDGVVFDAAGWRSPQEMEEGGRVYEVTGRADGNIELRFANGAIDFLRIRPGDLLWRTHDPALDRFVRPFLEPSAPMTRQPVSVHAVAHEGSPLSLTWTLVKRPELRVTVQSSEPLTPARSRRATPESIREQLDRLGNTSFRLVELTLDLAGSPFIPLSLINSLRREAANRLEAMQTGSPVTQALSPPRPDSSGRRRGAPPSVSPQLHLLVRTPLQLEAALEIRPASITLDYLDLYGLRPSIDRVKASGIAPRAAAPRVWKPGEERILDFLLSLDCPLLVRSTGMVDALRKRSARPVLTGDFSLNVANSISLDAHLALGLARITPTHDLNAAQIADLAAHADGALEVIAWQHLPIFHTEHCVFCRFLSTGASYKDCGRPCEQRQIALRDEHGRKHPVIADVGCRNTVFNAEAQSAGLHLEAWLRAGISHYRLEFVTEPADHVRRITNAFFAALRGDVSGDELTTRLIKLTPQGITEGSLFTPNNYAALPIL